MTVAADGVWTDLLDPGEGDLPDRLSDLLHQSARQRLLERPVAGREPRPKFEVHGDYLFGVLLVPHAVPEEDRVVYQEVDLVLARDLVVTVRKTPPDGDPWDPGGVHDACAGSDTPGMVAYHLVDDVAERYLDLVDDLHGEIEEIEDSVEELPSAQVRARLRELRHDLLRIRRTLAPTRDGVRAAVDNRLELEGEELFPREVEIHLSDAHDKLLRASEGLDLCRDLVASIRDFHQSQVANEQNEVMKRLTLVASLLLLPTLIAGVYGQNFDQIPGQRWSSGFWFSLLLIAAVTVGQLLFFRWKRWF